MFRSYSAYISMYISKICILFCSTADRQHRQELKATWSRLNRQSGGTMIPGAGPVTRKSVSTHTSVGWKGLKHEIEWKRCGVFGYCSDDQWLIIDHVNVVTFKSILHVCHNLLINFSTPWYKLKLQLVFLPCGFIAKHFFGARKLIGFGPNIERI